MTTLFEPRLEPEAKADLTETLFALAKMHYATACFSKALPDFEQVAQQAWQQENFDWYTEVLTYLLRIFLEQEQRQKILETVSKIQSLLENQDLSPTVSSRAHYMLALVNRTLFQNPERARQHLNAALELALRSQNHKALAYPIYGSANLFFDQKDSGSCLTELDKLDQILNFHPLPDLKVTSLLLRAFVFRDEGQFSKAHSLLCTACEELKAHRNLYLYLQTLYGFGSTYLKKGDLISAQIYLDLAKATCPGEELPRLQKHLVTTLNQCRTQSSSFEKSMTFQLSTGIVERKGVGSISLDSQFILRDLLQLFLLNPGRSFSKEELAEKVWKENYSPLDHDNKIYVTLKRLRQFLEPLFPDLDPILRSRCGYTFNQLLTVQILSGDEK